MCCTSNIVYIPCHIIEPLPRNKTSSSFFNILYSVQTKVTPLRPPGNLGTPKKDPYAIFFETFLIIMIIIMVGKKEAVVRASCTPRSGGRPPYVPLDRRA